MKDEMPKSLDGRIKFWTDTDLEFFPIKPIRDEILNYLKWLKWQNERIEQLEKALNEITELGWSERFGGGYQYMGEYHAEAIKIACQALGKEE